MLNELMGWNFNFGFMAYGDHWYVVSWWLDIPDGY
jgi:hypothetical protein